MLYEVITPNAILTSNPYCRPDDYGIPITAQHHDDKTVRNIKLPWQEIKRHSNPLWEKGYQFYCVTPKTRHRVHSQWSVNDWVQIYESNFGDPYRMDKRTPGVGEHQLHINPQAAKDRGINDGDYVYVDGNPVDRPYRGWRPSDPYYKVARLMIRAKYNPAFPYHVTIRITSYNVCYTKLLRPLFCSVQCAGPTGSRLKPSRRRRCSA